MKKLLISLWFLFICFLGYYGLAYSDPYDPTSDSPTAIWLTWRVPNCQSSHIFTIHDSTTGAYPLGTMVQVYDTHKGFTEYKTSSGDSWHDATNLDWIQGFYDQGGGSYRPLSPVANNNIVLYWNSVNGRPAFRTFSNGSLTSDLASVFLSAPNGVMVWYLKPLGSPSSQGTVYNLPQIIGDTSAYFGAYRGDISGTNKIWCYNLNVSDVHVGYTYTQDSWDAGAWVHTGGNISCYKNGNLVDSAVSGNTGGLAAAVDLGARGASQYMDGMFTGIILANSAWNSDQIKNASDYISDSGYSATPTPTFTPTVTLTPTPTLTPVPTQTPVVSKTHLNLSHPISLTYDSPSGHIFMGALAIPNTIHEIDPVKMTEVKSTVINAIHQGWCAYSAYGSIWASELNNPSQSYMDRLDPTTCNKIAQIQTIYGNVVRFISAYGSIWGSDNGVSESQGCLYRINPSTNTIISTITIGTGPYKMLAFSGYIWVVNNNDYTRQVQKIDPTTNSVVGTINLSSDGIYGAADLCTDGTWVYMVSVNYASQKGIARIDPSTLAVSYPFSSLSLPINATFVSCIYDPEGFLVICDYDNGCLYRINMYANTYFTIPVGGNPSDAILLNGYIYVACYDYYGTGSLYKICITPTVSPYKGKRIILETDNSERKFITDSKKKSFLVDIVRRVLK